jgi:hypothetical protein
MVEQPQNLLFFLEGDNVRLPWRAFLEKFDAIEWILDNKLFSFSHAQHSSENAQIVVDCGCFHSSGEP